MDSIYRNRYTWNGKEIILLSMKNNHPRLCVFWKLHTALSEGIQRNCIEFSICIFLDVPDILMSLYFGWFCPCGRHVSWLIWGGVNQVNGWSPLGLHGVFRDCHSMLFFAKPWDCVDRTSHISSLQNVRDVSDILFPVNVQLILCQFKGHSKISGQHSQTSATVSCFEQLTAAHIWDYFQGCHIYVWIISKNLNSFHFKLFWVLLHLIKILWLPLSLCANNLWQRAWFRPVFLKLGSLELQDSAKVCPGLWEMKPCNGLRVLLAVLHLYVQIKIHLATFDSNHFVTDSRQTISRFFNPEAFWFCSQDR